MKKGRFHIKKSIQDLIHPRCHPSLRPERSRRRGSWAWICEESKGLLQLIKKTLTGQIPVRLIALSALTQSPKPKTKLHLQGSTLLYTLLIALLISALLSSYVIVNVYSQHRMNRFYHEELAADNLRSGTEQWLSESFRWGVGDEQILFDTDVDRFEVRTEAWGLLGLLHGTGIHSNSHQSRSCLIGEEIPKVRQYSLYLSNQRQPLVLVGNTRLSGQLYLPPSGLRTGFIGRRGFERAQIHEGTVRTSESDLPQLSISSSQSQSIRSILEEIKGSAQDDLAFGLVGETAQPAWTDPAYQLVSPSSLVIDNSQLIGKCRIISSGTITVKASAKLDNCLLYARHIEIESGFRGRLQGFALESIQVGKGAELSYPSVLMLCRAEAPASMIIEEGATIEGAVIVDHAWFQAKPDRADEFRLAAGSHIRGLVYCDQGIEVQGRVDGQLVAKSFVLRTAGGIYRNHLIDASVALQDVSTRYLAPLVYGQKQQAVLEWL